MKFLVFGLGALGTVFATCLKSTGFEVGAFVKPNHLESLKNKTLKITGIFGEKEAKLDGMFDDPEKVKDFSPDVVILTVKSFDTEKAVNQIKNFLKSEAIVILAQNGYGNYEVASEFLGKERVLLARVIFGAKLTSPGTAEVTVIADDVVIGQPEGAIPLDRQEEIASAFNRAGIPTRVSRDVYKVLWDKILYNSALNPLGALLECNYGSLAEMPETRDVMERVIKEIFTVTKAKGIELNWESPEEYLEHFYKNLVPPTARHYPSMYYDITSGKRTEIDSLNGAIVKLAKEVNLDAPTNELITLLIKAKEKLRKS